MLTIHIPTAFHVLIDDAKDSHAAASQTRNAPYMASKNLLLEVRKLLNIKDL